MVPGAALFYLLGLGSSASRSYFVLCLFVQAPTQSYKTLQTRYTKYYFDRRQHRPPSLGRILQLEVVVMGGDREVKASPRGVVTYMATSREEDLRHLRKSLEALSKNFLQRFAYPVR